MKKTNVTLATVTNAVNVLTNMELAAMVEKEYASKELASRFAVGNNDNEKYATAMVALKELCKEYYKIENATQINKTRLFQRVKAQVILLCPEKDKRAPRASKEVSAQELFDAFIIKVTDTNKIDEIKTIMADYLNK